MKTIKDRELFVKPVSGLSVIDPATGLPLPAEGGFVANDKYWRRRLADRDVAEAAPPAAPKKNSK